MQRILALAIILVLLAFPVMAQEQKPFTPEQQIENLTQEKAQAEFNYHSASIKALLAEDKLRRLQKKYDFLLVQSQKLTAEKIALMGELKAANAKISQLEMKPKDSK